MTRPSPEAGTTGPDDRVLRCWGKTGGAGAEPAVYHPAVFHMLDAGNVARALLGPKASARWRNVLGAVLTCPPDGTAAIVPFMVALHDLGKVSAPFQCQETGQKRRLISEGFKFDGWLPGADAPHAQVGHVCLESTLDLLAAGSPPPSLLAAWSNMISAHHGRFAGAVDLGSVTDTIECFEPPAWAELRGQAAGLLWRELAAAPVAWPAPANVSAAAMTLAGFCTLCDWLASDTSHFPPRGGESWIGYTQSSRQAADNAIAAAGFTSATASGAPVAFAHLFKEIPCPRPLQLAVDAVPDAALTPPCLVIIEAPTGEGKTEAALALAHRLAQRTGIDDCTTPCPPWRRATRCSAA